MSDKLEITEYKCGNCNGDSWKIQIGKYSDGRITLLTVCSNEECIEIQRENLSIDDDSVLYWSEFDITDSYEDVDDSPPVLH